MGSGLELYYLTVLSHEQEGVRGWFLLGGLSLRPQWKGKCVGAMLLGPLVPIFELCQFALMHSCGRYRLEWKFLTNEKDFEAGSFLGAFLCVHSLSVSVLEPCCWSRWCRSFEFCPLCWYVRVVWKIPAPARVVLSHQ
jgi:hypothetical protein